MQEKRLRAGNKQQGGCTIWSWTHDWPFVMSENTLCCLRTQKGKWFSGLWSTAYFEGKRTSLALCFSLLRNCTTCCWCYIPPSFLKNIWEKIYVTWVVCPTSDIKGAGLWGILRCATFHFSHHPERKYGDKYVYNSTFPGAELVCGKGLSKAVCHGLRSRRVSSQTSGHSSPPFTQS